MPHSHHSHTQEDVPIPRITTTHTDSYNSHCNDTLHAVKSIIPEADLLSPHVNRLKSFTPSKRKEDLTIPVVEQTADYAKDEIIKQGLVLCTRTAQWYTKKKSTTRELQLRETRLRWRQFKAVLKRDRIELYHETTIFIHSERKAHVIYLNNKFPYRRVRLSLVSSQDYIWRLEFVHYETKSIVSFNFQSNTLSDAQDWYMSVYNVLPDLPACKKPIPPFVDIHVMIDTPMQIRIPLDYILEQSKDQLFNIRIKDIKPAIKTLLEKDDLMHTSNWHENTFRLCWRPMEVSTQERIKRANAVVASGDRLEWMTENTELICPQLIEQRHVLELHTSEVSSEKLRIERKILTFDSLLINKTWTKANNQQKFKCKKLYFYVVLYGHHLFFFDGPYYQLYKRQARRQQNQQQGSSSSNKKSNWFSATTGFLFQQRKLVISKDAKKQCIYELGNQSSPYIKTATPESIPPPDPTKLVNAHLILDLQKVAHIQPMYQEGTENSTSNTFEIHVDDNILYYEAPSTQVMLQWVALIRKMMKSDHLLLNSTLSYRNNKGHDGNKSILQSGFLYVKHNYKRSFNKQYCILTKSQNYNGLMMYDTLLKDSRHQILKKCLRCADMEEEEYEQQREERTLYEKKRTLLKLENAYVYSGDECILDQLEIESIEPLRLYKDGIITGGNKTSECIFVIWQLAKRHFVPNVREYLSLLKIGHRLGNRGSCWVFKARSKKERDEWVWALHIEFGLLKL